VVVSPEAANIATCTIGFLAWLPGVLVWSTGGSPFAVVGCRLIFDRVRGSHATAFTKGIAMGNNVEVCVKIHMRPTQAPPTGSKAGVQRLGHGHFQIVLEGEKSLDIDALEDGLLRANFPALRETLATHLEDEVKKSRADAS
jgi:hypothetical protein